MNEVDMGSVGNFNFPNFLNMMLRYSLVLFYRHRIKGYKYFFRKVDEINAEEEIREAFKVFDSV